MLVRNFKILPNYSLINESCEIYTVNVSVKKFSIKKVGIYRLPGGDDVKVFCGILKTNINFTFLPSESVILCGDTNINTYELLLSIITMTYSVANNF